MSATDGRPSPQGDLEAIRRQLDHASADLYRQLALYQQVLRSVLPRSVDQALFHLVTQVHPARYRALSAQRRALFQRRIATLVGRCSCLLTVEQLIHLAQQMGEERQRQRRQRQRDLLEHLAAADAPGLEEPARGETEAGGAEAADASPSPAGSVHLGFSLPLSSGWLGWGEGPELEMVAPGEANAGPGDGEGFEEAPGPNPLAGPADLSGLDAAVADVLGNGPVPVPEPPAQAEPPFAPDFSSLPEASTLSEFASVMAAFAAAAERSQSSQVPEEEEEPQRPRAGEGDPPRPPGLFALPPGGGLLPRDPIVLLAWLEGYERALMRRLRNLSHALNGELMRAGLSAILLPTNLLDAVLAGQVEGQGGPANILRLQLPMGLPSSQGPLQAQAILLRCEDLELEHPQLRTVRRRLQQRRQEIRRMAHTYHRLQRRLQAREAEALWQQDIRRRREELEGPPRQG